MTEMPLQARRFQEMLDRWFPHGMVAASAVKPGVAYHVARPEVVAMHGLDPVVFLEFSGQDRNMDGIVTAWDQVTDTPVRVVRVTMDCGGTPPVTEVMLWTGNVSPSAARQLEPERRESLALSARGDLYRGDSW
jgi:hypothetical protein